MPDPKALLLSALDALESTTFDYVIYGGLAAGIWGEPRYTDDVDVVIFLHERELPEFLRAAAAHGFSVDEDLAVQHVQVSGWARIPLGDRNSPWHVDLCLGDSPFDQSALARRKKIHLFERAAWVASAEDVILYKLVSGRPVDLVDISGIISRQSGLDEAYLRRWADWWELEGVKGIRSILEVKLSGA
ncbi:MAG: hypothetical protein HY716_10745 [Planctomycetes bacterium]|nr:hypothetical protein [Planctomycetota bacterium]